MMAYISRRLLTLSFLAILAVRAAVLNAADERAGNVAPREKLNVLFISADDLRPQLGCYGDTTVRSPNIDRIAARGLVFNRAYCQQAVCSPSRTSLMTGRRPDTTKVYDLVTHFRDNIPDVVTLSQHFKNNGYHAQSLSKIYHPGYDDKASWSVPHWQPRRANFGPDSQALMKKLNREAREKGLDLKKRQNQPRGLPWEAPDVADNELPDGATADRAVELIGELKEQPFFLAVGFLKPHLPFVAPKKYWDLYSADDIKLAENSYPPKGTPDYAMTNWGELRAYRGIPKKGPLSEEQARSMVHGYYACISFMDAQVGRMLDALEHHGLADKTVVILWGDHGWQLGEHGMWCKHTNFETSTRAPLIISAPGQKSAAAKTDALVEFVDIYPSLAEICGLRLPEGLEGTSFAPLLGDNTQPWKTAVFSQYPRHIPEIGQGMGYSIRTDQYRLTEWSVPGKDFRGYELYDHRTDPGENVNLADLAEHTDTVKELTAQLHAGWKAAKPK